MMNDELELDQTINIWNKNTNYEETIELTNNHYLDKLFTETFIGIQETGFYQILLDEKGFWKIYNFLTQILAYDRIAYEDLDDREGIWELYSLMVDAIKSGAIEGIQLEYYLELQEEEEE